MSNIINYAPVVQSATQWKIDADARKAIHKTGFVVAFNRKTEIVPWETGRNVIEIKGIEALEGTAWSGRAPALVEEAVALWGRSS